jgi:hypothetical protein
MSRTGGLIGTRRRPEKNGPDLLHVPPHFHVRAAGHSAKVRIDTLEVLVSDLPRRELRLVLAWAEMHAAELDENWRRAREGATLQEIEPLR